MGYQPIHKEKTTSNVYWFENNNYTYLQGVNFNLPLIVDCSYKKLRSLTIFFPIESLYEIRKSYNLETGRNMIFERKVVDNLITNLFQGYKFHPCLFTQTTPYTADLKQDYLDHVQLWSPMYIMMIQKEQAEPGT